jgi:hypothetical protein
MFFDDEKKEKAKEFAKPFIESLKGKTFEEVDLIIDYIRSVKWEAEKKVMEGKVFN